LQWLDNLEEETNYLVSKGYNWSDLRKMECWRRRNYGDMNKKKDQMTPAGTVEGGAKTIASFLQ
jgi:hypothetical protein